MRRRGGEPLIQTQAVSGAGPEGHQQVHVAGTGAHGFPGGDIETCAEDELHRRGQGELHPGGQHPVHAEGLCQHRQHQRQRKQNGQQQRPAFVVQALGLTGLGGCFALGQGGGVAGLVDGGDQHGGVHLAEHFDVGALVGQVHADALHPGTLPSARSTRPAQLAQVMPPMGRSNVVVPFMGQSS
jgi:hypothetical protein